MVVFITYFVWDFCTKLLKKNERGQYLMVQRGWASLVCAFLGVLVFCFSEETSDTAPVLLADASLLSLVFLFRAMKEKDLSGLGKKDIVLIIALGISFSVFLFASIVSTKSGEELSYWVATLVT